MLSTPRFIAIAAATMSMLSCSPPSPEQARSLDCSTPGMLQHYSFDEVEVSVYPGPGPRQLVRGCTIAVADHSDTTHIDEHICRRLDIPMGQECVDAPLEEHRRNRHLVGESCLAGGCFFLDDFMDPLKFQDDLPESPSLTIPLEDQASFIAWVRPPEPVGWNDGGTGQGSEGILRADELTFGFRTTATSRGDDAILQPYLELRGADLSCTLPLDGSDGGRGEGTSVRGWSQLALVVQLDRNGPNAHAEVTCYVNGRQQGNERAPLPASSAALLQGMATNLQSLGSHFAGYLDEISVLDRPLTATEIEASYSAFH